MIAIVDAFDVATNAGSDHVYAATMAVSTLHGGDTTRIWTQASALLQAKHGCTKMAPVFVGKL